MIRSALKKMTHPCPRCGTIRTTVGAFANHVKWGRCGVTADELFWAKVDKTSHPNGCWLWTGFLNHDGYGRLGTKKGVRTGGRAHKVAWEMARGSVPAGLAVMHKCDTRACVRLEHLQLGTHNDNMADMARKGRNGQSGEKSIHAKLTPAQVLEIRARYQRTISGRRTITSNALALAAEYRVRRGTIKNVALGRTWKSIK